MSLFDIESIQKELENLESLTIKEGFWEDSKKSAKVLSDIKRLKDKVSKYNVLTSEIDNLLELTELVIIENDEEEAKEILKNTNKLKKEIDKFELETLFNGKYDANNAIVSIHPGAGGTESQDWAEMLYRMYSRWANKNNYQVQELDYLEGEEAGLKSVAFEIIGENAYGYMKGEMGVHRLVRISPFDSRRKKTHFFCFCRGFTRNY